MLHNKSLQLSLKHRANRTTVNRIHKRRPDGDQPHSNSLRGAEASFAREELLQLPETYIGLLHPMCNGLGPKLVVRDLGSQIHSGLHKWNVSGTMRTFDA